MIRTGEGIYRTATLRDPHGAARDNRVVRGVALGVLALALALVALWLAVVTGIFTRPSVVTLVPVPPAVLCALGAGTMAWRIWRTGLRRVAAVVIGTLAVLALAGAGLATTAYVTGTDPPPLEPMHFSPLFHC